MKIVFVVVIGMNILSFVANTIADNQSASLGWLTASIWSIAYYIKYIGTQS